MQADAANNKRKQSYTVTDSKFVEETKKAMRHEAANYDDIELAIIAKYKGQSLAAGPKKKAKDDGKKGGSSGLGGGGGEGEDGVVEAANLPTWEGQYLRRRALVDQMLMSNKKADFSYATHKRKWKGEEGVFNSDDLAAWFRVWNQTQIDKYKQLKNKRVKQINFQT